MAGRACYHVSCHLRIYAGAAFAELLHIYSLCTNVCADSAPTFVSTLKWYHHNNLINMIVSAGFVGCAPFLLWFVYYIRFK